MSGNKREQCKQIAALPHIKCTYSHEWGEFRVTLDGLSKEREEAVAYYCADFDNALGTAEHMSMQRTRDIATTKVVEANHARRARNIYT